MKNLMDFFKTAIAFLVSVTIISSSCRKTGVDPELPAATQEGKNTFGCKVDGRIWEPKGTFGRPGIDLSYDPTWNGGTMSIKASRSYRDQQNIKIAPIEYIDISLREVSKPGRYSFDSRDSLAFGGYSIRTQNEEGSTVTIRSCYYDEIGDTRSGTLNITKLDVDKGILSGTFEFTLTKKNPTGDCNPVLKITEGRFDLKI